MTSFKTIQSLATTSTTLIPVANSATTTTTTTTLPPWNPRTYSGSGTKIIDIELPRSQLATIQMSHSGARNFSIWSNDSSFDQLELLANEIGNYSGTRVISDSTASKLEISADGAWNIVIDVASRAPDMAGQYSGTGHSVLRYNLGTGTLRLTHNGERNFIVWSYQESGKRGDLLANVIGVHDATVIIRSGKYLEVKGDGSWTITKS